MMTSDDDGGAVEGEVVSGTESGGEATEKSAGIKATLKSLWRDRVIRFSCLALICSLTFGSYYCYDIPGALTQPVLQDWFDITPVQYELFYSLYAWPNTVLAFCGGYLVDRVFGIRLGSFVFAGTVLIGQLFFALGTDWRWYYLACAGRFIYGLGGECISVCQSTFTSLWFRGRELSLAFAIALSFARLGSAVNFMITPRLQNAFGTDIATWFGFVVCFISIGGSLLLWLADKKAQQTGFRASVASKEAKPSFRDILQFPVALYGLIAIVVGYYVSVFIWITIGSAAYMDKYGMTDTEAGDYIGIPYLVSACAAPVLGLVVDIVGFNLSWILGACILQVLTHLVMALSTDNCPPLVPMLMMGFSYSALAASLWPCVALLVPKSLTATAFGLSYSIQNIGLAIFPLIIGAVLEATNDDYALTSYIFAICAGVAALFAIALMIHNFYTKGLINSSRKVMQLRLKKREEAQAPLVEENSLSLPDVPHPPSKFQIKMKALRLWCHC
ncbi:sodium glucose transporter [Pelomyxa schiedti]|nr:sodium glucose transporter [Pelomyxa schiedti]